MEQQLWIQFAEADSRSLFFSKSSDIQRRLVVRWANAARSKAAGSGPNKEKYEAAQKRLQIIESCIKIHRSWVYKSTDLDRSLSDFHSGWDVLEEFARSQPAQPISCPFIWGWKLELQASQALDSAIDIVPELTNSNIKIRFGDDENSAVLQRKYLTLYVTTALCAPTITACKASIGRVGRRIFERELEPLFDPTLAKEVALLHSLSEPCELAMVTVDDDIAELTVAQS